MDCISDKITVSQDIGVYMWLLVFAGVGDAVEDEPFAHRPHDRVMSVDRGRASGDEADLAGPGECAAAVCALYW